MKKSLHSLLTAAMFAAAVTTSAGSVANAPNASAAPAENDLITETTTEPQCVYGPPEWFTSESELTDITGTEPQDVYGPPGWFSETETMTDVTRNDPPTAYGPPHWFTDTETEAMTTTTTDVTAEIPQPAYGPPYVLFEKGDLNGDHVINAQDLTLLKRAVLFDNLDSLWRPLGDLNYDGAVDKKDVKELIRRLTGRPEDEELPEETTTAVVTDTTTDTTITTTVMPLYGPPSAWN